MVGVVGSNPIVSTKFTRTLLIRDAEECRELAPQRDYLSAEARALLALILFGGNVFKKKQLRLLFCFYDGTTGKS